MINLNTAAFESENFAVFSYMNIDLLSSMNSNSNAIYRLSHVR